MRALIFDGEAIRLDKSRPAPAPKDEHAIVRLLRAALSDADLEVARGLHGFTGVLGHQFVGQIDSVRGKQSNLVGKRVVAAIVNSCGTCDMCLAGLGNHCRNRSMMGLRHRDGCLSDQFSVPVKSLVIVPESVDNDHAVFAFEVASAIQASNRLTIQGRPFVTVLGDGALALIMAQVMAKLNASVRVVGRNSERLSVCEKWGIKHRLIDDVGLRADQDIVVECTGLGEGLRAALQLVRPRGKIVMTTLNPANSAIDLNPIVLNEIEIIGAHFGPMHEAVAMLARREIDVLSLISKRMKLDDGASIFNVAAQENMMKVLVDP